MRKILMLSLLAGGTALAAGPLALRPGMTGVPDLGAISCGQFVDYHPWGPAGMEQAALTWAQGYMHARSGKTIDEILAQQPADGPDWNFDSLTGHILDFCRAQPDAMLPEAVKDLWAQLQ